jgi:hypothetical protein
MLATVATAYTKAAVTSTLGAPMDLRIPAPIVPASNPDNVPSSVSCALKPAKPFSSSFDAEGQPERPTFDECSRNWSVRAISGTSAPRVTT